MKRMSLRSRVFASADMAATAFVKEAVPKILNVYDDPGKPPTTWTIDDHIMDGDLDRVDLTSDTSNSMAYNTREGTTSPTAPFGIVAIPGSGTEGGPNLGAMNQAQTGSYGSLPSPAMPETQPQTEFGGALLTPYYIWRSAGRF